MKVLLLNPPYQENFIRSARSTWPSISGSNWYPIFLAYATGWLEKHGHEAKLLDALVENLPEKEVLKQVKEFQPELIALYISEQSLKKDLKIGLKIKKISGAKLILVGPWCSANPEKILRLSKEIDGIVPREFDQVLLDLANQIPEEKIKGLVFRSGKKIVSNPPGIFLETKQLDQFPFVSGIYKKHLQIKKYHQASLLHPFVDLFTGRGCSWGKCSFCLWPHTIHQGAPNYRTRSAKNVIKELLFIKKELPEVKEVFFQDDTLPPWRAKELSQLIIKNKIKLTWSCYSRADAFMDLSTLKLMKKAGCRFLHVGYESSNPKILKNINKGTTPAIMKKFTENCRKAGLKIHGDFILGLPGETEQTIKQTIKWAQSLGIEGYQFFIPQPQPETPLYNYLQKKGYLKKDNQISYPQLSNDRLNYWRFKAMRSIYFTPRYLLNTLENLNSKEDFFRLLRTGFFALPKMLKK